jgi:hypothetical protein
MTQVSGKQTRVEPEQDQAAVREDQASRKPYRKPELAKYEQLHGIGIGS